MATIGISTGNPVVIDPAVTAPAAGNTFCFQPRPAGGDMKAQFQATGTLTGLSSDLQTSLDGGTTWTTVTAAFLAAATAQNSAQVVAGALYRFNHTASTGNAVIRGVVN